MHNHAYIFFCILFLFPPILVLSQGKMFLGWERQYCSPFPFCGIGRGMAGSQLSLSNLCMVCLLLPCIMKWCDGSCADKQLSVGHPTTFKQGLIWITVIRLKLKIAWNKAIRNERNCCLCCHYGRKQYWLHCNGSSVLPAILVLQLHSLT